MRLLSLDVLRGIAVLLVIVRHSDAAWNTWLSPIRRGGWVGVDLFFVLSGYLVSNLLFREFETTGTIKPARFLIRRGWKIYPAFWVLIAVAIACFGFNSSKTLAELLFVQSYVTNRMFDHTWSLAIEEHFYLILPFFLMVLARTRFASLPRIVFAIMVSLLVARCINGMQPFAYQTHVFPTHLRLDGLFFGVLLAYWHRSWPAFKAWGADNSRGLIALGLVLLTPNFLFNVEALPALYTYWLTANILGGGAILVGIVCGGVRENWLTRTLGIIGVYSYSIYLWHGMAVVEIAPRLGLDQSIVSVVSISVLLGMVMARIVESPCLWLRDRVYSCHATSRVMESNPLPPQLAPAMIWSAPPVRNDVRASV